MTAKEQKKNELSREAHELFLEDLIKELNPTKERLGYAALKAILKERIGENVLTHDMTIEKTLEELEMLIMENSKKLEKEERGAESKKLHEENKDTIGVLAYLRQYIGRGEFFPEMSVAEALEEIALREEKMEQLEKEQRLIDKNL